LKGYKKMKIEIKNRWNGNIIIAGEYESIKDALQKNRKANLCGANLSGANLSEANFCDADLSDADLSGADFYGADFYGADFCGANLCGANLCGANLSEANFCDADLSDADLSEANLRGADLSGAEGISLPIITIIGSRHTFFYINDIIQIGCEKWAVDHWIENYQFIGENNDYTPEEIAEYKTYIDMIANLKKEKK